MYVIGTAGHIDHGKSTFVHKLTGIDPDRLREEKDRGMTIDLGFAWLKLPNGQEVGIVDVPGHERFIKNMLAGVGAIDLALLVVAANEGPMPQTREHLAILNLLGIRKGIVVLTKRDIVDEELLELVKLELVDLLEKTSLAGSPVIPVSAVTGEGLRLLISSIDTLLLSTEPRHDIGRPRLLVDRVFTIAGSGTVVTGTLIDGSLSIGQEIEIMPPRIKARLRGLQTHKTKIDKANPGSRVAANIAGISPDKMKRGYVITTPGWLNPTRRIDVKLNMLSNLAHPLRHGTTVSFFTGADEVLAKIHLFETETLAAGVSAWAQCALDQPVAAVKGDHFIIRSPMDTLGGGIIINANAKRHKRYRSEIIKNLEMIEQGTTADMVSAAIETKQPVELRELRIKCNLSAAEAHKIIDELVEQNQVIQIGQGDGSLLFTAGGWEQIKKKAEAIAGEFHRKYPARPGMPKGELGNKLGIPPHSPVLQSLFTNNVLVEESGIVRLPSYSVQLNSKQQEKIDAFLKAINQNPYAPPGDVALEIELLNLLIEQQKVVKVADGVVFSRTAYDEMTNKIILRAKEQGTITLAEVRDMFNTSRKYVTALLEYMDEKKLTRRVGDARVVR